MIFNDFQLKSIDTVKKLLILMLTIVANPSFSEEIEGQFDCIVKSVQNVEMSKGDITIKDDGAIRDHFFESINVSEGSSIEILYGAFESDNKFKDCIVKT